MSQKANPKGKLAPNPATTKNAEMSPGEASRRGLAQLKSHSSKQHQTTAHTAPPPKNEPLLGDLAQEVDHETGRSNKH